MRHVALASCLLGISVLASACGASIDGASDAGVEPDAHGTSPDPLYVCPAEPPLAGSSCRVLTPCYFPSGAGETRAVCEGGTWAVSSGACDASCPAQMPPEGACCSVAGGPCTWNTGCGFDYTKGNCVDGHWQVDARTCPCPQIEPPPGVACGTDDATCTWRSSCGGLDVGFCDAGAWSIVRGPCASTGCPASVPTDGAACSASGLSCTFGEVGTPCTRTCRCVGATWSCARDPGCDVPPEDATRTTCVDGASCSGGFSNCAQLCTRDCTSAASGTLSCTPTPCTW